MNKEFYTTKELIELFNLNRYTLYRWRKQGLIKYSIIGKKKFLYSKKDIENILNIKFDIENKNIQRKNIIYCRVSNQKQKQDLETQKQLLINYCNSKGIIVDTIYTEIASGMNEKRIEFSKLLKSVLNNEVDTIFITYKDRLTRFGFEYFENIFKNFNCKIIVLNNKINELNFEEELTNDMIAIIHRFSMKLYSNRRKQFKQAQSILEQGKNNESNNT